ncbi:MAG: flagellar biosynthetic protein FliO [Planctomycetota bacterium]
MSPALSLLLQDAAERSSSLGGHAGPDLSWLTGAVLFFVSMLAVLAFGFRRLVGGSLRARASKRDLRVLDVLPLGGKRQLAVVRCYDRTFALGLADASVDLVAELDTEAVDHDRSAGSGADRADEFIARLEAARTRLLGTRDLTPAAPPTSAAPASDEEAPSPATSTREFIA